MADPTPIKYSDLVKDDGAIETLISQLKELIGVYDEAAKRVSSAANDMAKSLNNVSGASEEQRNTIALVSKEADRLEQEYRDAYSAQMEAKKASLELAAAKKEESQVTKLLQQLNVSAEGSYNRLSAQYRLLKIRINEMGEADEKAVKQKRAMEKEAQALYARMNDLQKATGKYTLQVGNYERALGGALGVNMQFVEALTNTEKASEILNGAFKALLSPIGLVTVAIGAAVAAIKLFKDSIHSTQVTGDAFDNAMAGWTSSWDYFKRAVSEVNFTNFINGLREAARAGRELQSVLDELDERRGSLALQRAMMADENAILLERLRNQKLSNAERIKAGKDYLKAVRPIYEREQQAAKDQMDAELNDLFAQANKRKKLTEEEKKIGQEQLANFILNYDKNLEQIRKARELNKALADPGNVEDVRTLFIAQHADADTKALMDLTAMYDRLDNERIKAYRNSAEDYGRLVAAYREENRRIITQVNSLENAETKSIEKRSEKRAQAINNDAEIQAKAAIAESEAYQKRMETEADNAYALQKEIMEYQIAATEEGTQEMLDLRIRMLELGRAREIELNNRKTEEMRIDEALINAKYDQLELKEWAKYGKGAEEAVEEGVGEAKSKSHYSSIWEMFFPKEEQEGVREAVAQVTAQVIELAQQMIGLWTEAADKAVESADKQVESAQRVVDAEREAAANGYANRAKAAEKDLALAKKNQEKALKEQERAQKVQLALNSVLEASQMVVASANIWSTFSGMGPAGPAIAIAMLALMWGSFLASKAKAMAETGTEKYAEGTVELLQGGSHASGHDISLGRKADGTERRAEGGEFFAVINKRNSRRYRNIIPEVIDSFNDGTFADKYQRANDSMAGYAVEMIGGGADLSRLEKGVDAIQRQGEQRRTVEGDFLVVRYKNLTQKIKN